MEEKIIPTLRGKLAKEFVNKAYENATANRKLTKIWIDEEGNEHKEEYNLTGDQWRRVTAFLKSYNARYNRNLRSYKKILKKAKL